MEDGISSAHFGRWSGAGPSWLVAPPLSAALERGDPHRGGAAYSTQPRAPEKQGRARHRHEPQPRRTGSRVRT
ncbi:hypothetical protein FPZ41_45230 [Streptomyces sp. K1PN6]|uniref:Uncharacterized protein n=1 Tax=Streptomyces acidicola TaxID=2596892 RepID=A0A5N8X7H7_9ACTN|nr:hypothetical protein [Streptomyces acidicola]